MHRCMCGVTKLDRVRNGRMREARKVGKIARKVQERTRNWCGHNYDEKRIPLPRKKGDGNGSTIT